MQYGFAFENTVQVAVVYDKAETSAVLPQKQEFLRRARPALVPGTFKPSVVNTVAGKTYLEAPVLRIRIRADVHVVPSAAIAACVPELSVCARSYSAHLRGGIAARG